MLADGRVQPITSISHYDEITTVINLPVTDIHTFYVGDESVLVHDASACSPGLQRIFDEGGGGSVSRA